MPRVVDPILTEKQIDKAPIADLRKAYRTLIAHYKVYKEKLHHSQAANSKFKIDREQAVKRVEEKHEHTLTRIRINRDRRISKATWRYFKSEQKSYALTLKIKKRLAPITGARVKNKRELMKKSRAQGYDSGVRRSIQMRKKDIYRKGFKDGQGVRRNVVVDSIARTALLTSKLSKVLGIPAEYVSMFLWMGAYDSFIFSDLKSAMEAVGDDYFYRKIYYLKQKTFVHGVGKKHQAIIWALTPLGREVYNRAKSYVTKYIHEQKQ